MFHTLTYGKGLMGSHASQLTKTERWKTVHWVQNLIDQKKPATETKSIESSDSNKNTASKKS